MAGTKPSWLRHTTIGMELFAAVLGMALFGLWIDRHYGTGPRGLLVCSILGLVGGLYNFIRTSLRMLNPPGPSPSGEEEESEDGHE